MNRSHSTSKSHGISIALALVSVLSIASLEVRAGEILRMKSGEIVARDHQAHFTGEVVAKGTELYHIVQFQSVIRAEDRQLLVRQGAKIVRYMPDDALIVKAKPETIAALRKTTARIGAVVRMEPAWKQSTDFAPASVFSALTRQEVLVRLFPGENPASALDEIRALNGADVVSSSGRSLVVRLDRRQIEDVAAIEAVEWVQPNPKIESFVMRDLADLNSGIANRAFEDITGYESGTRLMGFEAVWARGFTGRGQIASMADTGLDVGNVSTLHRDFNGRVPSGYAFGLFSKTWEDPMGHGTHVAGSVMGGGQASNGLIRGGAFEASLVAESLWSPMLDNLSVPSRLGDLFAKAYADGARVHTNSWGSAASTDYDNLAQQVDEFASANPDMLILFAAGNSGTDRNRDGRVDPGSIGSPATAKNVLTVGASKNYVLKGGLQYKLSETKLKDQWPVEPLASSSFSENPQGLAAFSSRGPTKDGRTKPEVVAPGTNILSVRSQHPKSEKLWGMYNNDYVWSGGTSMSTPLVAGAATVVRQYLIQERGVAQPSAALVKSVLMHTAVDLYPGGFGEIGASRGQEILTARPNSDEGYGRVDVTRATVLSRAVLVDEKSGVSQGEVQTYPVRVSGRGRMTVTLVYTDVPAAASAAKALVNDLDLVVVDPNGRAVSLNDHLNNSEMIELDVAAGEYQVRVQGTNVPQGAMSGKQSYALVLSVQ